MRRWLLRSPHCSRSSHRYESAHKHTHAHTAMYMENHCRLALYCFQTCACVPTSLFVSVCVRLTSQVPVPPGAVFPPKILRTKWGTDPLFMGSYSYVNVTEATGEVVDALAEPLCNDDGECFTYLALLH